MGAMLNHALLRHCLAQGSASPALAKNTETNIAPAVTQLYTGIRYCELELLLLQSIPTLVAELPYALRLPSFIKIAITAVGEVLYYRALLQPCGIRDFWEHLLQNS